MNKKLCSDRKGRDEMCGSHDIYFLIANRSCEQDGCFLSETKKQKKKTATT